MSNNNRLIMKPALLVVTCTAALFFSFTRPGKKIDKALWLTGTWENKTTKGTMYESWKQVSDYELSGKSYIIKEKDTVLLESVQLKEEENQLYYIPTVKNQNNGLPVRFALKRISAKEMVFENPGHDFPQVITYTQWGSDSLVAEISGVRNGQVLKQTFPMKKVN
jgi:hypothetical protein